MNLQRVGVKFFCKDGGRVVDLQELIPIFHRWIQSKALDELLIDVADYSHVDRGPGILLVAHEGIFGLDETGGRRGLVYYLRRPTGGALGERLIAVARSALRACEKLAAEPEVEGRLAFSGEEMAVFANDRLAAPNDAETVERFRPALDQLLAKLHPGVECAVERETDERERLSLTIKAPAPAEITTLLERLGA